MGATTLEQKLLAAKIASAQAAAKASDNSAHQAALLELGAIRKSHASKALRDKFTAVLTQMQMQKSSNKPVPESESLVSVGSSSMVPLAKKGEKITISKKKLKEQLLKQMTG